VILRGKQDINLCIITAYRVCANKYTGPKTAYQQQKRQLSAMYRAQNKLVNPDPNCQFILNLHSWISHLQQDGTQVIIGIDNNDELNPSQGQIFPLQYCSDIPTTNQNHNGSLDTLIRSTGLIDILHHHHKSSTYPPTYIK